MHAGGRQDAVVSHHYCIYAIEPGKYWLAKQQETATVKEKPSLHQ
jgi:hypothetical protein